MQYGQVNFVEDIYDSRMQPCMSYPHQLMHLSIIDYNKRLNKTWGLSGRIMDKTNCHSEV